MRVVVAGGAGFIGSHLCGRLVADGHDVTAVDTTMIPGRWQRMGGADMQFLDLTDLAEARLAVRGADWVFHLAADVGGVGHFHSDADLGSALINSRITANVFEAVTVEGVARTYYACSACAYPVELQRDVANPPLLAEHQIGTGTPEALYGAEKLHGLRLAEKVPGARVGIQHAIYGPGMDWERRPRFPAAVACRALDAVDIGKLEVWGDGSQLRSYLYIDDCVDMIMTVMEADAYHGPVNIGANGAVSCRDVARMCLDLVGADAEIVTNGAAPSGVMARNCSSGKFWALYGEPPDRSLRSGFGSLIDWLREVRG